MNKWISTDPIREIMYKKNLLIIYFFILNVGFAQLPYSEIASEKSKSEQNAMVKMVDSLGYKYYGVTDSIMDQKLNNKFHSSKLKLLLVGMYEMSETITQSISQNRTRKKLNIENATFYEIRKGTLLNLKKSSNNLAENENVLLFLDFNTFIESINSANAYCDEIISFRRNIGNLYIPTNPFIKGARNLSEMFEQSRGADGLTDEQWLNIMKAGGGSTAPDLIRTTSRKNQNRFIKLKKRERATVESGEIQRIETFSNTVDGDIYIYQSFPPEQISFLYTSDNELVKGLVNWLIFINSGNSIELSEMFRVGTNESSNSDKSQLLSEQLKRDIKDKNQNNISLEFVKGYFNNINFSNIKIEEVKLENNQITFFGQLANRRHLEEKLKPIFIIENINGDLLERLKFNINQMRKGLNEYNDSIMDLSRY